MSGARAGLLLLFGVTIPSGWVAAQVGLGGHHCCQTCTQPLAHCTCTTVRPVVETTYRRERCVTHRDVCETHLQPQQVVQRVAVQKHRDVVVDEGCYQMVWVPKPVTRRVSYTECHDQVSTRMVPVTVRRTVPQVTTRIVPQQRVRYVAEQRTVAVPVVPPVVARPVCATCATPPSSAALPRTGFAAGRPRVPTSVASTLPVVRPGLQTTTVRVPVHRTALAPSFPQRGASTAPSTSGPVPDPRFRTPSSTRDDEGWTPIRRRSSD